MTTAATDYAEHVEALMADLRHADTTYDWPQAVTVTEGAMDAWATQEAERLHHKRTPRLSRLRRSLASNFRRLLLFVPLPVSACVYDLGLRIAHCSFVVSFQPNPPGGGGAMLCWVFGGLGTILGAVAAAWGAIFFLSRRWERLNQQLPHPSGPKPIRYEVKILNEDNGAVQAMVERSAAPLQSGDSPHVSCSINLGGRDDDSALIAERFNAVLAAVEAQQSAALAQRDRALAARKLDGSYFEATLRDKVQTRLANMTADDLAGHLSAIAAERLRLSA